ncbi:MAG TPA: SdpI family protein [Candidatus Limnocylindrales bacterium]|nr:SdpI family protein [Candidatus Limnocylindrales bacterium]
MGGWTPRKLLAGVFLLGSVVFVVLALPLITGQITPNSLYGVRLPQATNDPTLWFTVNALAGWWLAGLGVMTAVLALLLYRRPSTDQQYAFRVAFPLMSGILLGLVLLKVTYLR